MSFTIVTSIIIGIFIGGMVFYLISLWRGPVPIQSGGAKFSEKDVESLLLRSGYEIIKKRAKETIITNIDGKDHFGSLEADYIVRRNKKDFVVVVKTGEEAADPNEPIFRRRLVEYERVFQPEGLLVMDVDQGQLHRVNFRFPHEKSFEFFFNLLIGLFIILAIAGIIWLLATLRLL